MEQLHAQCTADYMPDRPDITVSCSNNIDTYLDGPHVCLWCGENYDSYIPGICLLGVLWVYESLHTLASSMACLALHSASACRCLLGSKMSMFSMFLGHLACSSGTQVEADILAQHHRLTGRMLTRPLRPRRAWHKYLLSMSEPSARPNVVG